MSKATATIETTKEKTMSKATATIETRNLGRHALTALAALLMAAAWLLTPAPALACGDLDGDGICNGDDNCLKTRNPDQFDSDGDGYGDACDCDYNQDGKVDNVDLEELVLNFGDQVTDVNPIVDSNGNTVDASNGIFDHTEDGVIGGADFAVLIAAYLLPVQPDGSAH